MKIFSLDYTIFVLIPDRRAQPYRCKGVPGPQVHHGQDGGTDQWQILHITNMICLGLLNHIVDELLVLNLFILQYRHFIIYEV